MSISAITLMPARSGGASGGTSTRSRTGTRCTTLIQLAEAFCGGSTENSAEVAGLMLATLALHTRFG